MPDIVDMAQSGEHREREAAISVALIPPAGSGSPPVYHDGKPHCRECDEVIPAARLKAVPNTGFCVNCAAMMQQGRG